MKPNKPSMLVLIRHAESKRNEALNGALFLNDPTLLEAVGKVPDHKIEITEKGWAHAKQTSSALKENFGNPDVVFHSGYKRTKETAEGLLSEYKEIKIPLKEDLSLREREGGYTHTLLESEKDKYFPYLQDYWNVVGGLFARPVGGESLMDVVQRLKPYLEKLDKEHAGKKVFLVTHGRVIQCLRFILDEMTWEEMENFLEDPASTPDNCGVTVYKYDPQKDKLQLDQFNKVY